jgi:hypothetical protein
LFRKEEEAELPSKPVLTYEEYMARNYVSRNTPGDMRQGFLSILL